MTRLRPLLAAPLNRLVLAALLVGGCTETTLPSSVVDTADASEVVDTADASDTDQGADTDDTPPALWRTFEATLSFTTFGANPFDPDGVAVDVTFESPAHRISA